MNRFCISETTRTINYHSFSNYEYGNMQNYIKEYTFYYNDGTFETVRVFPNKRGVSIK